VSSNDDERTSIEKLKKLGYRVRKPGNYVKSSLVCHEGTLRQFKQRAKALDFLVQEAVTEAFDLWLEAHRADRPEKK
jgi:hypothetical protein